MNRSVALIPALIGVVSGATLLESTAGKNRQLHRRWAIYTETPDFELSFNDIEQAWIDEHCQFGMPTLANVAHDYGPTIIVPHEGYVLQLSLVDKIPLWVSEVITSGQLVGDAKRKNKFKPDPAIPKYLQAAKKDYKHSKYDRGHQAPAANQSLSQGLNDETFFLTNMSPQIPDLNQQIWKALETETRSWVTDSSPVYTITGPIFYDIYEDDPQTSDGLVEYYTIGPGGVSVPTHFYKIALQHRAGRWQAIAFVLENRSYDNNDFTRNIRSIDWIEQRTGLDFFPDMEDNDEEALESIVSEMW